MKSLTRSVSIATLFAVATIVVPLPAVAQEAPGAYVPPNLGLLANALAAEDGPSEPGDGSEGASGTGAEPFNLPRFIRETGLHRIGGYVTLGLAGTTAVLGLAGVEEVHRPLGYITAGMAAGAATFGIIGYSDFLDIIWPHAVLNGLAVVGFGLNAFVWEWGSTEHIATGIGSVASMVGAWIAIQLLWN